MSGRVKLEEFANEWIIGAQELFIGAFEDDARRPAVAHLIGEFLRAYLSHDTNAQARLPQDATVPGVLELRAQHGSFAVEEREEVELDP